MKNYVKRIVSIALCICMLAGMICTGGGFEALADSMNGESTISKQNSLKTNENAVLGTEENPLIVLEIVPSYEESQIGYFFPGCEPIDMERAKYGEDTKGIFESTFKDVYDNSIETVYAFYDEIPQDPNLSVLTNEERFKTRTDINYYSGQPYNYGLWQIAKDSAEYCETGVWTLAGQNNGDFEYDSDSGKYNYVGENNGDYIWVQSDSGSDTREPNGDLFSYKYVKYVHKNTFLKYVYGEERAENFKVQVITKTPEDLADNLSLIDTADMISIHAASGDYDGVARLYKAYNKDNRTDVVVASSNTAAASFFTEGKDLTYYETIAIVKRMASDNPPALVLDKGKGLGLFAPEKKYYEYNCHKLLYMVLSYQPKVFWKNFGEYLNSYKVADGTLKVEYTGGAKEVYSSEDKDYPPNRFWGIRYKTPNEWISGQDGAVNPFLYLPDSDVCFLDQMRCNMVDSGGHDVFDKIYTYHSDTSMVSALLSGATSIEERDFLSSQLTEPVSGGITSDAFAAEENLGKDALSNLDVMKFILSNGSAWASKGKLRILEVQPCNDFIYGSDGWKIYYQSIISQYHPTSETYPSWLDDPDLLQVDTMPIWEFISSTGAFDYEGVQNGTEVLSSYSSDDLISKYDLIIIGSNQDRTNGVNTWNGYNDKTGLKNYAYTHVGDLVSTSVQEFDGLRYSAIDLTLKKMLELEDFIQAGKPVVVDGGLYGTGWSEEFKKNVFHINISKVDKDSIMYDFLSRNTDFTDENTTGYQLFIHDSIKASQMKKQMTENTCELVFKSKSAYPTPYKSSINDENLKYEYNSTYRFDNLELDESENETGSLLTYNFKIIGNEGDTYNLYLNIDGNGDGVYSGSQKQLSEVENMNKATGKTGENHEIDANDIIWSMKYFTIYDENNNRLSASDKLVANKWYTMKRQLPGNIVGMLPWKLEVVRCEDGDDGKLRSSAIGYTRVRLKSTDEKKKINVLQMNLTSDMSNAATISYGTYFTKYAVDINGKTFDQSKDYPSSSKTIDTWIGTYNVGKKDADKLDKMTNNQKYVADKFEAYLDEVEEFDVSVQFLFNDDWRTLFYNNKKKEYNLDAWKQFLSQYDMLIFGYQDVALFTANAVFKEGLDDYIQQGKSVIFSHDMVQSNMTNKYSQKTPEYQDANRWLRTVTGQQSVSYSLQDEVYVGSWNEVEDCDNAMQLVLRAFSNSNYDQYSTLIDRERIWDRDADNPYESELKASSKTRTVDYWKTYYNGWNTGGVGLLETSFVKIANNGQITTYPYNIDPVIEVLQTHIQNFSLNMEYEAGGDVNVWYNLTDCCDPDVVESGLIDSKNITKTTLGNTFNVTDLYSAKDGDGRNQFYIYNKGNITYTGLGHGKPLDSSKNALMTNDEIKLFVNTMISAYRQPEGELYVNIENADAQPNSGEGSIFYLDFDESLKNDDDESTEAVGGKIVTKDGKKYLQVEFSVSDSSSGKNSPLYYVFFKMPSATEEEDFLITPGVECVDETKDSGWAYLIEAKTDGVCESVDELKYSNDLNPKGYHIEPDKVYTLYVPYDDIKKKDGQISLSICSYKTYKNNKGDLVSTPLSNGNISTMYLPLFDLN